jgi:hypothetical protein
VAQTAAPDTSATPPADTSTPPAKKPAHHAHHKMATKEKATTAGDKAVDDLNAESLDAAKANKSFSPPTATPVSDTKPAKSTKPMKHKKVTKKAAAAAPADAAAPPADTTTK